MKDCSNCHREEMEFSCLLTEDYKFDCPCRKCLLQSICENPCEKFLLLSVVSKETKSTSKNGTVFITII